MKINDAKIAMKRKESVTAQSSDPDPADVFGSILGMNNWLKVPKTLIYIKRHSDYSKLARFIKSRHIHFILIVAAGKSGNECPELFWAQIAMDMGVSKSAARKTAYELRKQGYIDIYPSLSREPLPTPLTFSGKRKRIGRMNNSNRFDLSPLVAKLEYLLKCFNEGRC